MAIIQPTETHYQRVAHEISKCRIVPVLGPHANLCDRAETESWKPGIEFAPTAEELSKYLAEQYDYPRDDNRNLARVAQFVGIEMDRGTLYGDLHEALDSNYLATSVHVFLAQLAGILLDKGYRSSQPYPLIVTTSYDDVLENAFASASQPYHLLSYIAADEDEDHGKFLHMPSDGSPQVIHEPNRYLALTRDPRPTIVKIHGHVDRPIGDRDSYVVTEDDYIDYVVRAGDSQRLPATMSTQLRQSRLLFLGFRLQDWNLRVLLRQVWSQQISKYKPWAVLRDLSELEQKYWDVRDAELVHSKLREYVAGLRQQVEELPQVEVRESPASMPTGQHGDQPMSQPASTKHVFLSYCRDNKDQVSPLRDALVAAGEPVWWDQEILPGQDWKMEIRKAMRNSYAVILCLSEETSARDQSGIYPEAMDAIRAYREHSPGSVFLIPVLLSECQLPLIEIDDTRTLDRIQAVNLFPPSNWEAGIQRLVAALRQASGHA